MLSIEGHKSHLLARPDRKGAPSISREWESKTQDLPLTAIPQRRQSKGEIDTAIPKRLLHNPDVLVNPTDSLEEKERRVIESSEEIARREKSLRSSLEDRKAFSTVKKGDSIRSLIDRFRHGPSLSKQERDARKMGGSNRSLFWWRQPAEARPSDAPAAPESSSSIPAADEQRRPTSSTMLFVPSVRSKHQETEVPGSAPQAPQKPARSQPEQSAHYSEAASSKSPRVPESRRSASHGSDESDGDHSDALTRLANRESSQYEYDEPSATVQRSSPKRQVDESFASSTGLAGGSTYADSELTEESDLHSSSEKRSSVSSAAEQLDLEDPEVTIARIRRRYRAAENDRDGDDSVVRSSELVYPTFDPSRSISLMEKASAEMYPVMDSHLDDADFRIVNEYVDRLSQENDEDSSEKNEDDEEEEEIEEVDANVYSQLTESLPSSTFSKTFESETPAMKPSKDATVDEMSAEEVNEEEELSEQDDSGENLSQAEEDSEVDDSSEWSNVSGSPRESMEGRLDSLMNAAFEDAMKESSIQKMLSQSSLKAEKTDSTSRLEEVFAAVDPREVEQALRASLEARSSSSSSVKEDANDIGVYVPQRMWSDALVAQYVRRILALQMELKDIDRRLTV